MNARAHGHMYSNLAISIHRHFFFEYAKDMCIIAIKKENLTVQTTRIKRARWSYIWTNLADRFQVRYYIKWNNQTCEYRNVLWGFREELLSDPVERWE
jgi:hypothetical protein